MNKYNYGAARLPLILCTFFCTFLWTERSYAQSGVDDILASIEKNNVELQALRKRTDSDQAGFKSERALDAPEVGFNYLWGSPADIGNRKDISVTQSFDIAALSGVRGKLASSRTDLSEYQYKIERQKVMLEAKKLCINVIYCNAMAKELSVRLEMAETMLRSTKDMMARGEVDASEVNKAQMTYLAQKSACTRNDVELKSLLTELKRMNGGIPVEINDAEYAPTETLPEDFSIWYSEMSSASPELSYMHKNVEVNADAAKSVKMSNYPKLTAGYMAELVKGSNFRGLTLGVSIPLWSVRSRTRQANLSYEAAALEEKSASEQLYSDFARLYDKSAGLKQMCDDLSSSLSESASSLSVTESKFLSGEISMLDNIMEHTLYYSVVDEYLAADRDFHLALAELFAWNL